MTLRSRPAAPFSIEPRIPGDKSITHRAYVLGALASGRTRITGFNRGDDCRATLEALDSLGIGIENPGEAIVITGGGPRRVPRDPLDLRNSGTGLRLLLGVLAAHPMPVVLTGDASLRGRPVERVLEPLRRMGATAEAPGDHPPVSLVGGPLRGIRHHLPVPSAQVKSALLLAGIQATGETVITGGAGTRDHTERMLTHFGVPVAGTEDRVAVSGPQRPKGTAVDVPGDPSAATFYLAAAAVVPGSRVRLVGVSLNPTRTEGFRVFSEMGLEVERESVNEMSGEPRGTVVVRGVRGQNLEIGPERIPGLIDELPALAVAAAFAKGEQTVQGAGELRVKESDRLARVVEGLRSIGARVEAHEDGWTIRGTGGGRLPGGAVACGGDHRVAMAFLVAGLGCTHGVEITDPAPLETSDPHFLSNLKHILELQ